MTVKEVLKTVSAMIGREDAISYLNGSTLGVGEETAPTVNLMANLLNLVISELSATFIPMIKTETVTTQNGKVFYASLKENAVRIIKVYDADGKELSIKSNAEYLETEKNTVTVEYEYAPTSYGLTDTIGYTEKEVSLSTLAYGVVAEYSISQGNFDEAVMWHKRYVDSVSQMRKLKNVTVKGRYFV